MRKHSLHISTFPIPPDKPVNSERVAKIMQSRTIVVAFTSAHAYAAVQPYKIGLGQLQVERVSTPSD